MKSSIVLALLVPAILHAEPVTRLAAEWYVPGSSSPKEFALIDTATGTVRIGFTSGDGRTEFKPPVSTGIANVSDAAGGTFGGIDTITLTSPGSNRVALVLPDEALPVARTFGAHAGIGPSAVGGLDSGGGSEWILGSIYNGGASGGRQEVFNALGGTPVALAAGSTPILIKRIEPLFDSSAGHHAGFFSSVSGINTGFGIVLRAGAGIQRSTRIVLGGDVHPVSNVKTTAGETIVMGYRLTSATAHLLRVSTPITTSSTFSNTTVALPYPVSSVLPVLQGGAGNLSDGIVLVAADGSKAEWFRVNAAANALVATGVSFPAPGGAAVTGLLPLPGIGLVRLTGPAAGGPSSSFETYQWDGSAWQVTDSGKLPALPAGSANFATLLFYSANPRSDESARLLGIQNAPHWTRRSGGAVAVPASVLKESFLSSTGGLGAAVSEPVNAPAGTNYVVTNQVEAGLSIAAVGSSIAALYSPSLTVDPASGSYEQAFQVTALYDEERYDLLWRRAPAGSWASWSGPLGVGYDINFQFRLRDLATGESGAIVSRSYDLPTAALAGQDSDGDGVPDYVEIGLSLDPFGGADSDGDGVSDLAEILAGTDPGDPADFPATPADIGAASGVDLVAVARNAAAVEMANGGTLGARRLDGSLVAQATVAAVAPALPDGGTRGARLRADTELPADDLLVLDAPLYFDLTHGARHGREILRLLETTPPPAFAPAFTPGGSDLSADTAGWVVAAQAAAASYQRVPARTTLDPEDSAVSVLVESLVHAALQALRPVADPAPGIADFSFFPGRGSDGAKIFLAPTDRAMLAAAGLSLPAALDLAGTAKSAMTALADAIYQRHVTGIATNPGMMPPFDALRLILRGGDAPGGYVGAASPAAVAAARTAFIAALAAGPTIFRPVETWVVEIPAASSGRAIYTRVADEAEVLLLETNGERFPLEQGLGLRPGTRFSVTGFTDTPAFNGRPTMAVTQVAVALLPASSDRDEDGNLLDDEWERFFFGSDGQDPFSEPSPGYSLLQYFLDGLDPRGGDVPSGAAVPLIPVAAALMPAAGGAYSLDFEFPAAYADQFDFIVEASETLGAGSFDTIDGATIASLGGDLFRASVPASAATAPAAFFRVRIALK